MRISAVGKILAFYAAVLQISDVGSEVAPHVAVLQVCQF